MDASRKYLETQVRTASQEQLLLMLIDGAIRFSEQAKSKLAEKDIEGAHQLLIRAQRIMVELVSSLSRQIGDEIYNNLVRLYNFVYFRLVRANVQHSEAPIDEALKILGILRSTWAEAIEKSKEERRGTLPHPIVAIAPSRISMQG